MTALIGLRGLVVAATEVAGSSLFELSLWAFCAAQRPWAVRLKRPITNESLNSGEGFVSGFPGTGAALTTGGCSTLKVNWVHLMMAPD